MAHAEATAEITAGPAATMVGLAATILPAHLAVVAGHIIRRPADPMADMAVPIAPPAAITLVRPMEAVVVHRSAAEAVVLPSAVVDRAAAVAAAEAVAADHTAAVTPAVADARTNRRPIVLLSPNALRPA